MPPHRHPPPRVLTKRCRSVWRALAGWAVFKVEQSRLSYWLDLGFYTGAALALGGALGWLAPAALRWQLVGATLLGLASWTLLEYGFHRFVLHGVAPFARLHALHHARPQALICTPTVVSAGLIALLVFAPLGWLCGRWLAGAATLGVLLGYWAYSITHHATHHWRANNRWLLRRKAWHARHHHADHACFGVTTGLWDAVLGTGPSGQTHRLRP